MRAREPDQGLGENGTMVPPDGTELGDAGNTQPDDESHDADNAPASMVAFESDDLDAISTTSSLTRGVSDWTSEAPALEQDLWSEKYERACTRSSTEATTLTLAEQTIDGSSGHRVDAPLLSPVVEGTEHTEADNSTVVSPVVLLSVPVAQAVHDEPRSLDEERALFAHQVRQSILAATAQAELVVQVIQPSETACRNAKDQRSVAKRLQLLFVLTMVVLGVVLGATIQLWRPSQSHLPSSDASLRPSSAPSLELVYLSDGRQAFTSTRQLYDAVDAYVKASETNETESSDVAIQYGYPIGTWDVSRLSDFSRVFNLDRDRPLDTSNRLARYSTMNEDLSGWNVSRAITMHGMFVGASEFVGQGLALWDTSRVTDFSFMFMYAFSFDGNLSAWDISSATKMVAMFQQARAFNGDVTSWDITNVESTAFMFYHAEMFEGLGTGSLSAWNVANVRDAGSMFEEATAFRGDVSTWNTSRVENMAKMFRFTTSLNANYSQWQVDRVHSMAFMFTGAALFEGIGIAGWNTSRVTSLYRTFERCGSFNGNVSKWDVSRVTKFRSTFNQASSFNANLSSWNTSRATDMRQMFFTASAFSSDVSSWDTSQVADMSQMFLLAVSFNSDVSRWDVSQVTDMSGMFNGAASFNHSLCAWGQRLPDNAAIGGMFYSAQSCEITTGPSTVNLSQGPFCVSCPS